MQGRTEKGRDYFKVYQGVFNESTMKVLIALATKGFFRTLDCPVSTGKEADVYRATTKENRHLALKIYRVETSSFKNMVQYIDGDPRFHGVKKTKRAVVDVWCQKEFRNLQDAERAGVMVPSPIKAMKNILVMEFIGKDGKAAPLLKDVQPSDPEKLIDQLVDYVRLMYTKAGIVHADINEFNVMMLGEEPVIIDIGQAVSVKHPKAIEFLERDIKQLGKIAKKLGVVFDYDKVRSSIV